jgi:hypothetical protein
MISLIKYLIIFTTFGVAPIYLFLHRFNIEKKTIIVISVGFSPVLISLFNILNTIFDFGQSIQRELIIPALTYLVIFIYLYKKKFSFAKLFQLKKEFYLILISSLIGIGYWFVSFYFYKNQGLIYKDVLWNLGLVNEFKNHFPPHDPFWYNDTVFIYHYLTDIYLAGMSNLTGLEVLPTMHLSNLFTSISFFVILGLFFNRPNMLESLIVFILAITLNFAGNWDPFMVLTLALTGARASTFFWALPILFASIYLWFQLNEKRATIHHGYLALIIFLNVLILYFSKSSFIAIFIFLEFYSLVIFLFNNKCWRLSELKANLNSLIKFIYYPVFSVAIMALFSIMGNSVFFGIEIRDFEIFKTWNPLIPFIAIYSVTILTILINYKNYRYYNWNLLFVSLSNLLLFFITKHPGHSDIYFAFVAIVFNALFIAFVPFEKNLVHNMVAFLVSGTLILFLMNIKLISGFNSFQFNITDYSNRFDNGDSVYTKEVAEYTGLSKVLPKNSLIAVPYSDDIKHFKYSAFIGRRMWNENNVYGNSMYSKNYYSRFLYFKYQKFIPDNVPDSIRAGSFSRAINDFEKMIQYDTVKFEEFNDRYRTYDNAVFGNQTFEKNDSIADLFGWTHILVRNSDTIKANKWIKSLDRIDGGYVTIYKCLKPAKKS